MMVCFICQSSMIVGPALADLAAANLMGIGATAQSVTGTLVQFLAGVVCAVNVHLTWLVHLYLAIPLIGILICLLEPEKQENAKEVQEVKKEKTDMSAIVTSNGLGTAAVAGTILSGYTIGGMWRHWICMLCSGTDDACS